MKNRSYIKVGIFGLAAIFLLSLSLLAIAQVKIHKKPPKPDDPPAAEELYKVSIWINGDSPGFKTTDEAIGCGSYGFFYATVKKTRDLFALESDGVLTPGPDGAAPLIMWMRTGVGDVTLDGCPFADLACHGNITPGYEGIFILFLKDQDGGGPNEDIRIRWMCDYLPGEKRHGVGWHIYSHLGAADPVIPPVQSTNLFPAEGLGAGQTWETDVIGKFWMVHDGTPCVEGTPYRQEIGDFNIHLSIERVQ